MLKKLSSSVSSNWGISQSDMYQMYVYHKKYDAHKVILIYPKTNAVSEQSIPVFQANDGVTIKALFVDLLCQNSDTVLSNHIWSIITSDDPVEVLEYANSD